MGRAYRTHVAEPSSPDGLVLPRTGVSSCACGAAFILSPLPPGRGGWPIPTAPFFELGRRERPRCRVRTRSLCMGTAEDKYASAHAIPYVAAKAITRAAAVR